MRPRHAQRIRLGIKLGRYVVARFTSAGWDAFSRGMQYRAMQPANKLEKAAYRRTWHQLEAGKR